MPRPDARHGRSAQYDQDPKTFRSRCSKAFKLLMLALMAMANFVHASGDASSAKRVESEWKVISSLPDPVGFAGMFAGVLNGRLVTGGGSKWDKPLWLQGTKTFSDRIFILATSGGDWTEQEVKVPIGASNFASAATDDAIYLAGGIGAAGCLRSVFELRAQGPGLAFQRLADLPEPVGYAAAALAGGRLYVVGGMDTPTAKAASVKVWSLGILKSPGEAEWRREADLPGTGVFVAAAAGAGDNVYVFGGMEFDVQGRLLPSRHAFRLHPVNGKWLRLTDLPEARVGPCSPCPVLDQRKIFLVGGYAQVFPGAPREHPGFSPQTLFYDLASEQWANGPMLPTTPVIDRDSPGDPGPAPMLGAPIVQWNDLVIAVSGEVRASVRSPAVLGWPIKRP